MKYDEWQKLEKAEDGFKIDGRYMKAYRAFMYNPENEYNCGECPNNDPNDSYRGLPCGQQNCWVWAHCKDDE